MRLGTRHTVFFAAAPKCCNMQLGRSYYVETGDGSVDHVYGVDEFPRDNTQPRYIYRDLDEDDSGLW